MKQWEKQQNQKLYQQRINNAKVSVPISNKKKSTKVNDSVHSMDSSISGLTLKEHQNKDSIPLYKLLKIYQLQQYAQQLISRGYGYDLMKFALLSENEIEILQSDIKVLPGHKVKLISLITQIRDMLKDSIPTPSKSNKFRNTGFSKKSSKIQPKPKTSQTQRIKPIPNKQLKITNLGIDFFQDESDYEDEQFDEALKQIMNKYNNNDVISPKTTIQPKTTTHTENTLNVVSAQRSKKAQDDIILITKFNGDQLVTEIKENRLIKNLQKQTINRKRKYDDDDNTPDLQISQIKHLYQSYDTGKLTSTLVNLDIEEMSNCLAWAVQKHIQFNKRNNSMLKNSSIPFSMDFKFRATGMQQDTSQNPIEEPTQLHLYQEQSQQGGLFQSQQIQKQEKNTNNYAQNNKTLAQISEKSKDDQELDQIKKKEIKEILKESFLHLEKQEIDDYSQNDQDYDVCSEEEDDQQDNQQYENSQSYSPIKPIYQPQPQQILKVNTISEESLQHIEDSQKIYNYSQSMPYQDQSLFQSKFDFIELEDTYKESRQMYYRVYYDINSEQVIPSVEVISNYCKNVIITSKMEKEVTILCLVYIERLLTQAGISLEPQTWRRVILISLIIASKIWDDESFENDNFAKVFPEYRTQDINEMERIFLILIDYRLQVKSSEYAKYYFILRMFTEKKKKSFPLRPLDLNTIMRLQKTTNQAEYGLRQKYASKLNKSF